MKRLWETWSRRTAAVWAALAVVLLAGAGAATGLALAHGGGSASAAERHAAPAPTHSAARPRPVDPSIAHASDRPGKSVNLTLDDGPDPEWTPRILRLLKQYHVHAVFCMIGPNARAHPDLVRRVVADGHRLCDHSVHHDEAMDHKSEAYQKAEILDGAAMIRKASGGTAPMYYRAPGGAFTPYSRHVAAARGMRPLGWNVDSGDWRRLGTPVIVSTVRGELGNGPTILVHDGGGERSQTLAALRQLLPWLKQHGYGFAFPVH